MSESDDALNSTYGELIELFVRFPDLAPIAQNISSCGHYPKTLASFFTDREDTRARLLLEFLLQSGVINEYAQRHKRGEIQVLVHGIKFWHCDTSQQLWRSTFTVAHKAIKEWMDEQPK